MRRMGGKPELMSHGAGNAVRTVKIGEIVAAILL